jgi:hypothetical protein
LGKGFNATVNSRENGRRDRYQYDDAGQLTQAAYQAENAHDTAGTAERTDAFRYDEMGNRTGANWVASRGLMKFGGRNNKLNQYGSWENNIASPDPLHWGVIPWYDDAAPEPAQALWLPPGNGVLMGDGWNVAGFNALNQPVQMTSFFYEGTGNWMWFGYDPLGRCVKRWVGPADVRRMGTLYGQLWSPPKGLTKELMDVGFALSKFVEASEQERVVMRKKLIPRLDHLATNGTKEWE